MRLSISHKLMLALIGLTLVVLIATLGLARWSFERGFLDYVNALEQTRLTRISGTVARVYVNNNSQWEGIDTQLLGRRINHVPGGRPPPHMRPPPRLAAPNGEPDGPLLPPPDRLPRRQSPPTALIDQDGNRIVGRDLDSFEGESIDVPVLVKGQVVGMLKSQPKRNLESSIETAFSRQQWITSGVIGIASLLLAALVSWVLVRLLLSPVRRIVRSVNRLSKGDYTRQLLDERQDELGQLMGDINHLTTTLEKNQTARKRWIADISHELRTPLAVLVGEVEALKDGIRPFNKEQLSSLDQELQRLCRLTDDLYELSISDIGGLRYEFAEMDLAESVNQIIKTQGLNAQEKGIALFVGGESSVIISADAKRIDQMLSNLINNSLAYTDGPGQVDVHLQLQRDKVVLTLLDTPPGVSSEECSRLFDPLYRQDAARTRRGSGAGLGLAICTNIVEAHRGSIVATPSRLGGLQIKIELPLAQRDIV